MVSLDSAIRRHAAVCPDRTAIIYEDAAISYGDLVGRIDCVAAVLARKGIRKGEIVALLMRNSPAFIELALAAGRVGAIVLPINYRLSPAEIAYILDHAGAKCLFVDEGLPSDFGIPAVVLDQEAIRSACVLGGPSLDRIEHPHSGQAGDIFRLMYTSGTTDHPKGVMHTYSNFFWKCLDHAIVLGLGSADRLLICGPLYHVGAFDLPGLGILLFGGTVCLQRDFSARDVLDAIARHRMSGAWLAPIMMSRVLAEDARGRDLTSFRWCVGGGERTPEDRIHQFDKMFPNGRYIDSYGLTETCSGDTFMPRGREIEKIGSVGTAVPHVEISIRDELGDELGPNVEGEICISGPKVSLGYWRDHTRTQASFFGKWFRTGDVGLLDADGFLTITDRRKDMIISGGENIASSEIERVIQMLPQVSEAAVVGMPDEKWGERPLAVVVLKSGMALREDEFMAHCSAHLARFKLPARVEVREELPRNASGKVLKRQLRDELLRSRAQ